MRAAVTVSLVPEARRGPFVYHVDGVASLADCCRRAAERGFDAVEVFPAAADLLPRAELQASLAAHGLGLAAVGTGAGWLRHGLQLCAADRAARAAAVDFIAAIVAVAAEAGGPAIIGSMQGRSSPDVPRETALDMLADALGDLATRAEQLGQILLYEPLNRYETDLFNRQAEAADFLAARGLGGVRLLCDLFHMGIEERNVAGTIAALGPRIGHVHWADSNRQAMGHGHTDPAPIAAALRSAGFAGHLSAEVFPLPSADEAADASLRSIRRLFA
ncbi:MAG: sugar phosphate isomerase/epimerase [Planctomycetes bacterium]|nr:sugar phosphate isomerase/epimerase [Planctomycetota bacterium]